MLEQGRSFTAADLTGNPDVVVIAGGLTLGLLIAAFPTRWLGDLLYETSPRDPLVFAAVAVVLATAGLAAAVVPVRRSAAVDPLRVLRVE